jgi:hypothetical protein
VTSRRGIGWVAIVMLVSATAATGAEPPHPKAINYTMDEFHQTTRPVVRALDPVNAVRAVIRKRRPAANVDGNDQVRLPSTWWTPRVGFRPVTPEDMLAGTGGDDAPAAGKWTIVKTKDEGVTPGFQMTDAKGVKWAVKLDPIAEPEMASAADVIGSKLMWAAGYNVPTNVAVTFARQDLVIKKGLTYRDPLRGTLPFDEARLDTLLGHGARLPDGRWRVLASRFLEGKPIGEFSFDGRRKDDPEDLIPHDLRRELRGLWVIAAWINHDDCSARNTLDMWVTEHHRSFVRHHLIDFSGTLGSASVDRHPYRSGYEYGLDFGAIGRSLVTLGLFRPKWDHAVDPKLSGVGFFDSATFDPGSWRPLIPNPAFDARTDDDIRWGVRIIAGFDEGLIRAAVHAGRLSDPRSEDYLVRILLERRDMILHRWPTGTTAVASDSTSARQ